MRVACPIVLSAVLAAAVAAGCGSSGSGQSTGSSRPAANPPVGTSAAPAGSVASPCGDGPSNGPLRATGVSCDKARAIAAKWSRMPRCASPARASRFSCAVSGYRCLGSATDRGIAVSCARPRRSISFIAQRR